MLQVARLAPKLLGDSTELVANFLRSQVTSDGGFAGRDGMSDLYYTVFGLEGLLALRAEPPVEEVGTYLRSFGEGSELDLVHATCLARCWAALPAPAREEAPRRALVKRIDQFRSADGGFEAEPGAEHGTVYGCFLACGGYQDLQAEIPSAERVIACVQSLRASDGGFSNQQGVSVGLTPVTAGAVTLLRNLGSAPEAAAGAWLLKRCAEQGGFFATPDAPVPDLLSTATALHALVGLHIDIEPIRERCLDFLDSLWTRRGGFFGNWADDAVDCEYTYYGLLSLGHLSL